MARAGETTRTSLLGHEFRFLGHRFHILESSRDTGDGSLRFEYFAPPRANISEHVHSLRFLVVCSGAYFVHTYPDGSHIEHVAALYEATEVEGGLRVDEDESLELEYFGVEELPRMQPLSRFLLEQALEVLAA